MTEQVPAVADDEPAGDLGDQASRLQMLEEQEAIRAALAGDVHGTDAVERDALAGAAPDAFGLAEDGAAMALDEGSTTQPETD